MTSKQDVNLLLQQAQQMLNKKKPRKRTKKLLFSDLNKNEFKNEDQLKNQNQFIFENNPIYNLDSNFKTNEKQNWDDNFLKEKNENFQPKNETNSKTIEKSFPNFELYQTIEIEKPPIKQEKKSTELETTNHLECSVCGKSLSKGDTFFRGGEFLCKEHFDQQTKDSNQVIIDSMKKNKEDGNIGGHILIDKETNKMYSDDNILSKNSKPQLICEGCKRVIKSEFITIDDVHNFHPQCVIRCATCNRVLLLEEAKSKDGQFFCEKHFLEHYDKICPICLKPIHGRCVNAFGYNYHVECAGSARRLYLLKNKWKNLN
ncbi:hypothetical protein M0811_14313 [Anaeramoeba ignava]|uniref:LIM zinc-binding domain-containing protein n=1 Tax=Anaeramoeba ignava TaxID=1746090 RepID=A0A9Q0LVP9_ANAIG|nr:hypothetical protein M0811_14313 [Anaeramoeba ignava]|eukprot:Anaeramoba_ignava/a611614_13.p1 GENE.a611614_13~~a611614_13.p1  ORF type:complete len:316 (-),score=86.45 a611614_13:50-997(-)